MPERFTPVKKSKIVVADSSSASDVECDSAPATPVRIYNTKWVTVQRWKPALTSQSQIDREIDEIMERSLIDAGYRSEHVSNSKATDRSYFKETHVSICFVLLLVLYG